MRIEVTQEDIHKGSPGSCCGCPIALALRRQLPEFCYVSTRYASNGDKNVALPVEARTFITLFDAHQHVAPFTFELEL